MMMAGRVLLRTLSDDTLTQGNGRGPRLQVRNLSRWRQRIPARSTYIAPATYQPRNVAIPIRKSSRETAGRSLERVASRTGASAATPALAVYDETLYCVHRGGYKPDLWWTTFKGGQWTVDTKIGEHLSSRHLGLAVHNDAYKRQVLYCVHTGG
jgi:hypothetical protein